MKKIAMVLLVLLLFVVGFGFYRGWFALSSPSPDMESNKVNFNLAVDPDMVKDDAQRLRNASTELTGQAAPAANVPDAPVDGVKTGNDIE